MVNQLVVRISQFSMLEDKMHREYTTDGCLYYEGEFRSDNKEGYCKIFYADGTLYYQGSFREVGMSH
ncbi:hypothetical protein [Paenibacillus agricola]|uniref:MORN repeat protein n=1 Tax=Paenibacillus agricola TaxID=2716264 RepID=A0ABX0JBU1_9BACL|nr:hypothetical protein [Paenibacillus agricola]NHN32337.1 hypothetical protein [Paenibacillus agricola]